MFEVMTDIKKVNASIKDSIKVKGHDEYALLYNWLESLLVNFELENILYSKFDLQKIKKISDTFILKATIWGEKFNPEKHDQKVGVKAITYHQMRITKEESKVTLKFILDI